MSDPIFIVDYRHPAYAETQSDWTKYRLTYSGGEQFIHTYLKRFSTREDSDDFALRKSMTPIPAFAKAAVNEIRNAVFQRMRDVIRSGGSDRYRESVAGLLGGVDLHGSTMNAFLGMKVLTELLTMGRVGIYVDSPELPSHATQSNVTKIKPYIYKYDVEDILSWSYSSPGASSEFKALLLRDTKIDFESDSFLPSQTVVRYRRYWINDQGTVSLQYYTDKKQADGDEVVLELTTIPFVMLDLGDSLLKDICQTQVTLLNLCSSDVAYALQSNFPFYVEQVDGRGAGTHLKQAAPGGSGAAGAQGAAEPQRGVGTGHGQQYSLGTNQPAFINPSAEPLRVSLELQRQLKDDIREQVNLAVQTLATRGSAESKSLDNQGLEAGLSYIGLTLETAEHKVAQIWAMYESANVADRQIAVVKYPDRYSLKTDSDRIRESQELSDLMRAIPGSTVKRELSKLMVTSLLSGKISNKQLKAIFDEIETAPYTTSDPDVILKAHEGGACSDRTASLALGFNAGEAELAKKDRVDRIAAIATAQGIQAPGARGVDELAATTDQGSTERKHAALLDNDHTAESRTRGDANTV